jgi:biopolymer transport protein ExbD
MRFRRSRQEEVNVNLTPLIDVVFLLLIFFMVTTTFTRETQLQINLPDSQSELEAENNNLIEVLVDRTGTYAVNGQVLIKHDIESLKQALKLVSNGDTDASIVITADAQAPHQAFVHALDAVAQQGFSKVSITTQAESSQ